MSRTITDAKRAWFIVAMAAQLRAERRLSQKDYEDCVDAFYDRCEAELRRKFPETTQ